MTNNQESVSALMEQILYHKKHYYTGTSKISDAEYDLLEEKLKLIDPNNPVLSFVGYDLSENSSKVVHIPPMLSLSKTYAPSDIFEFAQKYTCVISDKLDGMALALEYSSNGKLLRASTRGSGVLGEDVTEKIFYVASVPKQLKLPKMPEGCVFEVRGEIFFPISQFPQFAEKFDSYRNAVPGTFGRKEIHEASPVLKVLRFCAYDALLKKSEDKVSEPKFFFSSFGIEQNSFLKKLAFLESLRFTCGLKEGTVAPAAFDSVESTSAFMEDWFSKSRDYQIDGIVVRIDDELTWDALGVTAHHPRGSVAFKQASEVAITKILQIEESIGRSSKMTFRAKLEPVYLSGAKISHATLHNAEFIEKGGYAPGAVVRIKRSGEVIPSIVGLETPADKPYVLPQVCPCGYPAVRIGPDLMCVQKIPCAPKDQESLVYFAQTLEILGISDRIISKMRESGLLNVPADLFRLTEENLLELEGFAKKSAQNAVAAIQGKRTLPLALFLTALGLKRGGAVKCQQVASRYLTLDAVREATAEDLMLEKGWAQKSAEDFVNSLKEKEAVIDDLLTVVKVTDEVRKEISESQKSHPYFGKSICITGALSRPREEYKGLLERLGAKLVSAVTSKTDFLVSNETSSSSKFVQATKLNIPILTEEDFAAKL